MVATESDKESGQMVLEKVKFTRLSELIVSIERTTHDPPTVWLQYGKNICEIEHNLFNIFSESESWSSSCIHQPAINVNQILKLNLAEDAEN